MELSKFISKYFQSRISAFGYAFQGIWILIASQAHAKIHTLASIVVFVMGLYLHVTPFEWAILLIAMALVWVSEGINTAIEFLADAAVPEQHPLIGKAKDVAAGSVLLATLFAIILGLIVFIPHLELLLL